MPHFIKVVAINLAIIGVLALAYFALRARAAAPTNADTVPVAPSEDASKEASEQLWGLKSDGEAAPDLQVIDAYELTKNPFRMKDRDVILDTGHLPAPGFTHVVRSRYGIGSIHFERMLADRMAIYSVSVLLHGDDEELEVELPDNDPPDTSKPWIVLVEGTTDGMNGFGATISIATVQFLGYTELPPAPVPPTSVSVAPPPTASVIRLTPITLANGDISIALVEKSALDTARECLDKLELLGSYKKLLSGCRQVSAESRAAAAQIKIFLFCADFREANKSFPLMQMAEKKHTRRSREKCDILFGSRGSAPCTPSSALHLIFSPTA